MITDEFEHYFRLCVDRELSTDESRKLLFAVSEFVPVIATDEDVAMVYHYDEEDDQHCYDVNLERDISADEGDKLFQKLEYMFLDDDFECESSMDTVSEQLYLNRALLEQLNQKL